MKSRKTLFAVHVEVGVDSCPIVEDGLERAGIYLSETQDVDAGRAWFNEYFKSRRDAVDRLDELRPLFAEWVGARKFSMKVRRIAELDWSESWKKTFHTARVSRRIVIKPSWENFRGSRDDCVIELDPGMSFGTGLHPTTRACLRYIDQLARENVPGRSLLDAGCGSGVLAIAAARLGFERVVAVDFDPVAVKVARENCLRNGVSRIVRCLQADLVNFKPGRKFSVVAANMFSSEHERFEKTISAAVAGEPPGYLLVAGTTRGQYQRIRRMYKSKGLVEVRSVTQKEWRSGMFRSC